MDWELVQRTCVAAAFNGAKILRAHFGNLSGVRKKGAINLVTEADTEAEAAIIQTIRSRFPDHSILAEESGLAERDAERQWIIDPLDGTTNFAHGLRHYAISIAFLAENTLRVGVVMNPEAGEIFSAMLGQGATRNGEPIRVSATAEVAESLLVTGFPYDFKSIFPSVTARFLSCLKASRGVRRLGSAALDLCDVACGRFDGFWEENLQPWDTAAGVLIAREAGALVTDFADGPFSIFGRELLATNGRIHAEMLSLLKIREQDEKKEDI